MWPSICAPEIQLIIKWCNGNLPLASDLGIICISFRHICSPSNKMNRISIVLDPLLQCSAVSIKLSFELNRNREKQNQNNTYKMNIYHNFHSYPIFPRFCSRSRWNVSIGKDIDAGCFCFFCIEWTVRRKEKKNIII